MLRTFVAVARLGSFSAAAVELGYTQAAISQQIAALESDLKVPLLNRRPVSPTEAGARLLEHAEALLLRLDAARADVTRMTQAPAADPRRGRDPAGRQARPGWRWRWPRYADGGRGSTSRFGSDRAGTCSPPSRAASSTSAWPMA